MKSDLHFIPQPPVASVTVVSSMEWMKESLSNIFPSPVVTALICCLIVVSCVTGDYMLYLVSVTDWSDNGQYVRALTDSSTHGLVGVLAWAVVESPELRHDFSKFWNCIFCGALAAFVDIDHFISAGSIDLKKALNLTRRPYFHNTSMTLAAIFLCMWLGRHFPALKMLSLMLASSVLSHHLRDANHRGLWFSPLGHTSLFPSYLYIGSILLLAVSLRTIYTYTIIGGHRINSIIV